MTRDEAKKVSAQERAAMDRRELNLIDAYPDIEEFHQNAFLRYLDRVHTLYLVNRKKRVKSVDGRQNASAYQARVRDSFRACIEPIPAGEPVKSLVTGTLDKGSYLIEKLLIQSLPGQLLSANYYYPKQAGKRLPAILFLCGHSPEGKANPMYVSFCVEAVSQGYCVLTFDPIGQGERRLRKPTGSALDPVDAHCLIDQKLTLLGEHLAQFMMRDNLQALEYLLTRPEVDPARIAVTGNSGGGTMAAYMAAYEDRVQAAAPCCYITELRALLHRILAQDAEQCLPGFMASGLDLSDLVTAAAPKPYFIGSALFDFFPIDGTRDAFIEAKRMYRLLGAADNLQIYVSPNGHGLWRDLREQVLRFFCRHFWLPYVEDRRIDYDRLPNETELLCDTGEAVAEPSSQYGFLRGRPTERGDRVQNKPMTMEELRRCLPAVLGMREASPEDGGEEAGSDGLRPGPGGTLCLQSEPGMIIRGTWRRTAETPGAVMVVVGGMETVLDGPFSAVLTVYPRGTGPDKVNERSSFGIFDPDMAVGYNARMLGTTLQGMRVRDVLAAIRSLRQTPGYSDASITISGREEHALTALYAGILADVKGYRLEGLLSSFRLLLENPVHAWEPVVFVPAMLDRFDIRHMLAALRPGSLAVNGFVNHMKRPSDEWAPFIK